jgi:hypothetical protein
MGYNHRNDEIRDNIGRMQREWEAERDSLATIRRINARLSAKGYTWFWPKIVAASPSRKLYLNLPQYLQTVLARIPLPSHAASSHWHNNIGSALKAPRIFGAAGTCGNNSAPTRRQSVDHLEVKQRG